MLESSLIFAPELKCHPRLHAPARNKFIFGLTFKVKWCIFAAHQTQII